MSVFAKKTENGKEAGLALIWVLMVVAVTSALSLAFLQKVSIGISTTGTRSDSIQAQYLAEAAANHALWRLLNQETFPVASDVYYMHALGDGRYGYKVRRHTNTTFATVAVVGGVGDAVVHQSYVVYVNTQWYHSDWKYRQKISISADVADSDLADFPYMVNIADAANDLFMNAQLDGEDIVFTDSQSAAKLDHELEKYVSLDGGEELVAWVKLPALSSSAATDIYMYYGNHAAANQENAVAVWSNGYECVYHLHDDVNDSLGNHNGTNTGSSAATGQMADARDFYPADGYDVINIGTWALNITNFTMQAWIKSDDGFAQDYPRVISKAEGTSNDDHVWMMSLYPGSIGDNRLRFRLKTANQDSATTAILFGSNPNGYLPDANQWYLVAMTYDGSEMRIIRDGLDAGSTGDSEAIRNNDWPIQIGKNPYSSSTTSDCWDGKIDEVRISTVDRSIDWMLAEYRNQGSPATYQVLETEESRHLGGAILLQANFDSDDEGFLFLTDTFRSTSEAAYASGDYIASGGYAGGALRVVLGGIDGNDIYGMSGGWRQTFDLAADSDVSISFVYKLTQAANYESDEFSQALVSVDGTLYGEGNWWDTAWLDQTQITFDNSNSAEDLTDFPLLVTLTAADVDFDKIKAGGADIRFVDADGTLLNHEIEAWDDGAETAKVWVMVPQIDAGSNTDFIYLYYNNTGASDAQNAAAVWPAGIGVWHLAEDPAPGGAGDIKDSDGSANNGTAEASMSPADLVAGRIGNAIDFDGYNDYIDFAWTNVGNTFTIEVWIKPDSSATSIQNIVANSGPGAAVDGFRFFINDWNTEDGRILFETGNGSNSNSAITAVGVINLDQWNHLAVKVDRAGGSATIYHNGVDVTVDSTIRNDFDTGSDWEIGEMEGGDSEFKGVIDEFRISNVARSADWIEASFLSQNGTFAFNTFGGQGAGDTVAKISGDGEGGSPIATAWHRFYVDLGTLSAGTHTLIIGGYNNLKTYNDESTEIIIDDVIIRQ